jgi:tetraacyldisaccharide 4'-kinase
MWNPFNWLFFLLSQVYGLFVWIRNQLFEIGILPQTKVNVAVVSVGNLTAGGTGKTPILMLLLQWAHERGLHSAVVTRGYGSGIRQPTMVKLPRPDPNVFGDEPSMIAEKFPLVPVIISPSRVKGAKYVETNFPHVDVIFLDDGFQHRYLRRDLDIVVIDTADKIENLKLLPHGRGREPLKSLARADFVILNKVNLASKYDVVQFQSEVDRFRKLKSVCGQSSYEIDGLLHVTNGTKQDELHGRVLIVSGLGNPEGFERSVKDFLGEKTETRTLRFSDHHRYQMQDIKQMLVAAHAWEANHIVFSEKDAIKLRQLLFDQVFDLKINFWSTSLSVQMDGGQKVLKEKLNAILG